METRAKIQSQVARKQKEDKEDRLRQLALLARTNRAGIRPAGEFYIFVVETE